MTTVTIFGNQQIAIDILQYLLQKKHILIQAVVGCETQQDLAFGYPSLKVFCKEHKIVYFDSEIVFNAFASSYPKIKADIYLSIYFRKIFTKKHLAKLGEIINIHPSLLPRYRGPSPTLWALLNNEKYIGVTIHYIDHNIDTGDIIAQQRIAIPEDISGYQLNSVVMQHATQLFKKMLPKIIRGSHTRSPQITSEVSYYGRFHANLRKIDWFQSGTSIRNKIRALTFPYNGAIAFFKGRPMILWSATFAKNVSPSSFGPGKIIVVIKNHFIVTTVDVPLKIVSYSFENKKDAVSIRKGDRFDVTT